MSERSRTGTLRWASGFMLLVWLINFGSCVATEGMVPATIADITAATDQLGEASFLGSVITTVAYVLLGVAGLGFYVVVWLTWVRNMPGMPEQDGGSEHGRALAVRLALGAELRVFFHLGLVLFAVGNFEPFGWVGIATQVLAAASVAMAMVVLYRAARLAGKPHGDLWLVAAAIAILFAATEVWVITRL